MPALTAMSFVGTWTTVFRLYEGDEGIPGTLEIWEEDGRLVGRYQPNNGAVSGTAAGMDYRGTWRQQAASGSGLSNGGFSLRLDPTGRTFSGTWCYHDGTDTAVAPWTGTRIS